MSSEIDDLRRRIERLEAAASRPCEYEARPYHYPIYMDNRTYGEHTPFGAWCTTHGWHCPNNEYRAKEQLHQEKPK